MVANRFLKVVSLTIVNDNVSLTIINIIGKKKFVRHFFFKQSFFPKTKRSFLKTIEKRNKKRLTIFLWDCYLLCLLQLLPSKVLCCLSCFPWLLSSKGIENRIYIRVEFTRIKCKTAILF